MPVIDMELCDKTQCAQANTLDPTYYQANNATMNYMYAVMAVCNDNIWQCIAQPSYSLPATLSVYRLKWKYLGQD